MNFRIMALIRTGFSVTEENVEQTDLQSEGYGDLCSILLFTPRPVLSDGRGQRTPLVLGRGV